LKKTHNLNINIKFVLDSFRNFQLSTKTKKPLPRITTNWANYTNDSKLFWKY